MQQNEEQRLRYLLSRGKVSGNDCAKILEILDSSTGEASYWKRIAEAKLVENNELRAEVARLNQIKKY
jgi:hypothetical protein